MGKMSGSGDRAVRIKTLASKFGSKFGDAELVKLNSVAVVNLLIEKGVITDDEYQNQILSLLTKNAASLV